MCLQDIKIGDATKGSMYPFTAGVAAILVVPQSAYRRAITLGPPQAGTLTYRNGTTPSAGLGLNLTAGASPVTLLFDHFGDQVTDAWFVIADAANRSGCVIEGLFLKQELKS